jgi:type VI protein secretion system component VasK
MTDKPAPKRPGRLAFYATVAAVVQTAAVVAGYWTARHQATNNAAATVRKRLDDIEKDLDTVRAENAAALAQHRADSARDLAAWLLELSQQNPEIRIPRPYQALDTQTAPP